MSFGLKCKRNISTFSTMDLENRYHTALHSYSIFKACNMQITRQTKKGLIVLICLLFNCHKWSAGTHLCLHCAGATQLLLQWMLHFQQEHDFYAKGLQWLKLWGMFVHRLKSKTCKVLEVYWIFVGFNKIFIGCFFGSPCIIWDFGMSQPGIEPSLLH